MNTNISSAPLNAGTPHDQQIAEAWTVGAIARHFGVPVHRVVYIIKVKNMVPASRAGHSFVYDVEIVRGIGDELRRIGGKAGG